MSTSEYVDLAKQMLEAADPITVSVITVRAAGGRDRFKAALMAEGISLYPYKTVFVATRLEPYKAWRKLKERGD